MCDTNIDTAKQQLPTDNFILEVGEKYGTQDIVNTIDSTKVVGEE